MLLFFKKLCKNKENPELNNGTGFICFVDEKLCHEILEKFDKTQENPAQKIIFDPENNFEINGRQMFMKSALPKEEAKNLHKKVDDTALREKLKKNKINFSELIQLDRENKRHFHLAKKGVFVSEDSCKVDDPKETEKRENHFNEKLVKMKNPNFKISPTRILLKNINKDHDEAFMKAFVLEILLKSMTKKDIKNKKIIKDVKILKDVEKENRSKVS